MSGQSTEGGGVSLFTQGVWLSRALPYTAAMCLRSISLLSKLVVTLALRSSSQTASQDATIDSYLELHADYLKTLDAEDASIISNVAEVERTSTRPMHGLHCLSGSSLRQSAL